MISGLLLLLGSSVAQETGLSASASLNLVRPCERDADCSLTKVKIVFIIIIMIITLTQACVDGGCRDPCSSGSRSVCPMEGGLCKVVGHHDYHEDIFASYYYHSRWSVTDRCARALLERTISTPPAPRTPRAPSERRGEMPA